MASAPVSSVLAQIRAAAAYMLLCFLIFSYPAELNVITTARRINRTTKTDPGVQIRDYCGPTAPLQRSLFTSAGETNPHTYCWGDDNRVGHSFSILSA